MSAISIPQPTPHIVIFGRDQAGKPHASWFDQASAELATKAAAMMNMRAVPVETEALRELVGTLPRGRVFASGKAFTPFVNGKLYGRLVELTRELLGLSQSEAEAEADQRKAKQRPNKFVGDDSNVQDIRPGASRADGKQEAGAGGEASSNGPGNDNTVQGQTAPNPAAPLATSNTRPTRAEEVGIGSIVLATTGPTEGWFEAEVIGINGSMFTLRWCDYTEPTVVRRSFELGFLPALAR